MKPFVIVFVLVVMCSCSMVDNETESPAFNISTNLETNSPASSTTTFGDLYEIATSGSGVHPPVLNEKVLSLWVSFSGGCEEHNFTLNLEEKADTVKLWFTHNSNSDPCEAYLTGEIEMDLTQAISDSKSVELLNPNGELFTLQ